MPLSLHTFFRAMGALRLANQTLQNTASAQLITQQQQSTNDEPIEAPQNLGGKTTPDVTAQEENVQKARNKHLCALHTANPFIGFGSNNIAMLDSIIRKGNTAIEAEASMNKLGGYDWKSSSNATSSNDSINDWSSAVEHNKIHSSFRQK